MDPTHQSQRFTGGWVCSAPWREWKADCEEQCVWGSRELSLRSPPEPGVKALQPVTAWYPVAGSLCVGHGGPFWNTEARAESHLRVNTGLRRHHYFPFLFFKTSFICFVFGRAGSPSLCVGFLSYGEQGLLCSCSAPAPHRGGFSRDEAQSRPQGFVAAARRLRRRGLWALARGLRLEHTGLVVPGR